MLPMSDERIKTEPSSDSTDNEQHVAVEADTPPGRHVVERGALIEASAVLLNPLHRGVQAHVMCYTSSDRPG